MEVGCEGYQSIKNPISIVIEGLTALIGESNIGKSSLIRLILAIIRNQKSSGFISKGKDKCIGSIKNNNHELVWIKTPKSVEYLFDGKTISTSGRDAPLDEIRRLGFDEIVAHGRTYYPQFQKQFDSPFIISENSPIAAAQLISASKEGQILVNAIRLAQKDQSNKESDLRVHEDLRANLQKSLKKTEKFERVLLRYSNQLNVLTNEKKLLEAKVIELGSLNNNFLCLRNNILICNKVSKPLPSIVFNNDKFEKISKLYFKWKNLKVKFLILVKVVRLKLSNKVMIDIMSYFTQLQVLLESYCKFNSLLKESNKELDCINVSLSSLNGEKKNILSQLGYCPMCERGINNE